MSIKDMNNLVIFIATANLWAQDGVHSWSSVMPRAEGVGGRGAAQLPVATATCCLSTYGSAAAAPEFKLT